MSTSDSICTEAHEIMVYLKNITDIKGIPGKEAYEEYTGHDPGVKADHRDI